ncbi:fasciclin domain-containing protein [Dactylosporangium siamense]|uniref:Lipoprotein n=1 Tax=Dactylosporangium siamense TaxID=685454 RepID=A0A919UFS9_9ACTN|nr:fasciclin domain-containing protein [Dactylosporangium siamense]GIG50516.1 lipoprotein [Dactylosporangium siamense]
MRAVSLAAALMLVLAGTAACGSSDDKDTAAPAMTTGAATTMAAPTSAAAMADAPFGAGCAAVPTDPANAGSFTAMAKVPVGTAAAGNPVLKTLVTAAKQANLVDTLNTLPAGTVFAPTDAAFAKIPQADLAKVLADNKTLTSILTYHVIGEKLTPAQLAGTHKTVQGTDLTVTGSGTSFTVNGASMVVCGNVQTANAIVYIVDTVLMPKA